ncbi:MAG: hypothetical protein LLG06_11510 [Desulfobacteraceae bacterium]|nr:hypothetical protein [Desulfobacteraceae bacterium]
MADIIEFGKKADDLKSERETSFRQRKIEALRKIFQCTRCVLKCSKCGAQIEERAGERTKYAAPYTFCNSCQAEYEEFRGRAGGAPGDPSCYWHNDAWMQVWNTWLEHQRSLDRYRQSKEFLQLLDEVEELLRK